jgi:CheY-like chemotaxis protein
MKERKQKVNILLVDDNPSNLLALETILQAPDRYLVRASSGEEALRFLLDWDAAVVLLDVNMPGIGGLETAALIRGRERTHKLPIIFLTAYGDLGDLNISKGYSLGAVDCIVKPIDPDYAAWVTHRERAAVIQSTSLPLASDLHAVAHNLYFEKKDGLLNLFEARRATGSTAKILPRPARLSSQPGSSGIDRGKESV